MLCRGLLPLGSFFLWHPAAVPSPWAPAECKGSMNVCCVPRRSCLHQHRTKGLGQDIAAIRNLNPTDSLVWMVQGKQISRQEERLSTAACRGKQERACVLQRHRQAGAPCSVQWACGAMPSSCCNLCAPSQGASPVHPPEPPLPSSTVLNPLRLGKITVYKTDRVPLVSPVCDYTPKLPVKVVHSSAFCTGSFRNSHFLIKYGVLCHRLGTRVPKLQELFTGAM